MKKITLALAGAACLLATPVLAQDMSNMGLYGTFGYSHIGADDGINFGALTGRIGARIIPQFGVEAEGSLGFDSDNDGPDKVEMKHDLTAYLVGALPMTENASLIARLGYGSTNIETDGPGGESDDDLEGYRYGVGAEFFFDDANGLRIDFTRINADDIDADAYTVSYVRRF